MGGKVLPRKLTSRFGENPVTTSVLRRQAFRNVHAEHAERPLSPDQLAELHSAWDQTAEIRNSKQRYACRYLRPGEDRQDRVQTYHLLAWQSFVSLALRGRSPLDFPGTVYSLAASRSIFIQSVPADSLVFRAGPRPGRADRRPRSVPLVVQAGPHGPDKSVIDGEAPAIGRPVSGPSGESCDTARRAAFRLDWFDFLERQEPFTRVVIDACMTGASNADVGRTVGRHADTVVYHRTNVRRWLAEQTV